MCQPNTLRLKELLSDGAVGGRAMSGGWKRVVSLTQQMSVEQFHRYKLLQPLQILPVQLHVVVASPLQHNMQECN